MKYKILIFGGLFILLLILFSPACTSGGCIFSREPELPAGQTRIFNQTNNLIYLYLNDDFIDILKPQDNIKYTFICGHLWFLFLKREDNTIAYTDIRFFSGEGLVTKIPLYFKGVVNDSVKYKYDLQPLNTIKPTPDSIIMFEDKTEK